MDWRYSKDKSVKNEEKSSLYRILIDGKKDFIDSIKTYISFKHRKLDKAEIQYIFCQRMSLFLKEYDMVYFEGNQYISAFHTFLRTGPFDWVRFVCDKFDEEIKRITQKNINELFYECFYND